MRVVVCGHVCVDLAPRADHLRIAPGQLLEVGPLSITLGGSVANTARALAALGHCATVSARVGADDLGAIVAGRLAATRGIDGVPSIAPGHATSYSIVLEPADADRGFWHHVGANAAFDGTETDVRGATLLHLGYPSLLPALVADEGAALVALLTRARDAGATTSVDLAVVDDAAVPAIAWESLLRRVAPLVDVISPSADDLRSALRRPDGDAASFVDLLLGWGVGAVAVSDGEQGIRFGTASRDRLERGGRALNGLAADWAGQRFHEPAAPLDELVSTNGAGDAATAGLLSGLLRREPAADAVRRAASAAAAVIAGRSPHPDREAT